MADRKVVVAFVATLTFAFILFGPFPSGVESLVFGDVWEKPQPSIESVEVTRSGCHDDVPGMSMSSSDGTWISTVNDTSPHTEISAEIRLVSPDRADVTMYRLDVETHKMSAPEYNCSGAVRYEVQYDAPSPDDTTGLRVERYLNGELKGCGGSASGPDIGCDRLHEDVPTHWSNESDG